MTRTGSGLTLPSLNAAEREHSAAVSARIREELGVGGWLSFERFMELALYAPGLGYYSAGSVKLGAEGDFVTAPEVSDLFSDCVANQCAQVLAVTGGDILEFGAGTGRMAGRILERLQVLGSLPDRYRIVEVSADLAARQRARISRLPSQLRARVSWLTALPAQPYRGVVLANEVLDALPCSRFRILDGVAHELGVALDGGAFVWRAASHPFAYAAQLLAGLPAPLPEGYESELSRRLQPWIAGASAFLERGAALLFDYGLPRAQYYHPQRTAGTLLCHFRHRAHDDPFLHVGMQDITAWVDFTAVAEAAVACGMEVAGFATQAAFLLGSGIAQLGAAAGSVAQARRAAEARRLLLPGEMGEAFKVMALSRGLEIPLAGFAHQDLRPSL